MADRPPPNVFQEYWIDAWQRSILTLDILRERGNTFIARSSENAPHVLGFAFEVVLDGRTLARPVNYVLVSVIPPEGTVIDPAKPPYVVVDPRAGHGPGIGGMKQESEIGVALAAGHACYFVGFLPRPMPEQTIADVCTAEAAFLEAVAARHPEAESKPVVVGNCQAGWQIMMTAAVRPDLFGPILLAGSPLSYWGGVRGRNPMRYLGGTLGGTWLTALAGDLGNGTFDGANLVANFESLNPANTYWEKPYNLYSKADTEGARFLDFETWWGNPVTLNAGEMQWIADNLFVGNKLTSGEILTADGTRVDLRNIRSPIIVLCSWGDNITPPQQALGWVTDLYDHEDEIVANGQTIVYTLHQTIGHLGIFVSSKVATKEHAEFASCMEMIDLLPPGLYEAVITEIDERTANPGLIRASTCSGWKRARSTTSALLAATATRTSAASPPRRAFPISTPACTEPSPSPPSGRWSANRRPNCWPRPIRTGCGSPPSRIAIRSWRRSSRWPTRFVPTAGPSRPTIPCSPWRRSPPPGSRPAGRVTAWPATP